VDMRPYRRAHFLKVDDFRGKSPREFKIGAVTIGEKYGKPNLFSSVATNYRSMCRTSTRCATPMAMILKRGSAKSSN
jgi:hypothetical protein